MNTLDLRNRYLKWPYKGNYLAYKKIKNKCNTLLRKPKKGTLKKILEKVQDQVNLFGIQPNL